MASLFGESMLLRLFIFSAYFHQILAQGEDNPDILANMNVDRERITLSGFSSGGAFAQMLQFSFSSLFAGIAVFSHTFYRCGPPTGSVDEYDRVCTSLFNLTEAQHYSTDLVHNDIQNYQRRGLIENTANLRNKRLYVYAGLRSDFFTISQGLNILRVYERYINSTEAIFTRVQDANLVLPTDRTDVGGRCTDSPVPIANRSFFIGQCGFSGVAEAINFLLNDGWEKNEGLQHQNGRYRSRIRAFDQREFTAGLQFHQMDNIGYYYVPRKCARSTHGHHRCLLHFYFHGCFAGREAIGMRHVENTGLLELADRRGIIMIFPQAISTPGRNEFGCWDTFGVGGAFYATQIGHQVLAVKRMLDRVLGLSFPQSAANFRLPSSASNSAQRRVNGGYSRRGWRPSA